MLYNKDNLTKFILSAVYQLYEFHITQCFNKEAVRKNIQSLKKHLVLILLTIILLLIIL